MSSQLLTTRLSRLGTMCINSNELRSSPTQSIQHLLNTRNTNANFNKRHFWEYIVALCFIYTDKQYHIVNIIKKTIIKRHFYTVSIGYSKDTFGKQERCFSPKSNAEHWTYLSFWSSATLTITYTLTMTAGTPATEMSRSQVKVKRSPQAEWAKKPYTLISCLESCIQSHWL